MLGRHDVAVGVRSRPTLSSTSRQVGGRIEADLEAILRDATKDVRPTDSMLRFYNTVGRLPFRLGSVLMLLTSLDAIRVIWNAGIQRRTDSALQPIYNYHFRWWRGPWAFGDMLWQLSYNTRSVRARGLFVRSAVRYLLERSVREKATTNGHEPALVVSLGSGSASQFLTALAENGFKSGVQAILVDRDPRALSAGNENAQKLRVNWAVETRQSSVGFFLKGATELSLVEMVGLADYFGDQSLSHHCQMIYDALGQDGIFLGANISSRDEYEYAHGAACWPRMFYRTEEEIRTILEQSGFQSIWTGVCGLYTVWVAWKR